MEALTTPIELRSYQAASQWANLIQGLSWPLVKKLAKPDAGLPDQKVTLLRLADRSVIAAKFTDVYGTVLFEVPARNCAREYKSASLMDPPPRGNDSGHSTICR